MTHEFVHLSHFKPLFLRDFDSVKNIWKTMFPRFLKDLRSSTAMIFEIFSEDHHSCVIQLKKSRKEHWWTLLPLFCQIYGRKRFSQIFTCISWLTTSEGKWLKIFVSLKMGHIEVHFSLVAEVILWIALRNLKKNSVKGLNIVSEVDCTL